MLSCEQAVCRPHLVPPTLLPSVRSGGAGWVSKDKPVTDLPLYASQSLQLFDPNKLQW